MDRIHTREWRTAKLYKQFSPVIECPKSVTDHRSLLIEVLLLLSAERMPWLLLSNNAFLLAGKSRESSNFRNSLPKFRWFCHSIRTYVPWSEFLIIIDRCSNQSISRHDSHFIDNVSVQRRPQIFVSRKRLIQSSVIWFHFSVFHIPHIEFLFVSFRQCQNNESNDFFSSPVCFCTLPSTNESF